MKRSGWVSQLESEELVKVDVEKVEVMFVKNTGVIEIAEGVKVDVGSGDKEVKPLGESEVTVDVEESAEGVKEDVSSG